jgi:signal transduction histidine kinase
VAQDDKIDLDSLSVPPSQYRRLVVQTTDRILLIVLALSVYAITSNLYYGAMRMVVTALVTFSCLLLALILHRSGYHTPARFILLTSLNVAIFIGSFFLPTNSNLSMFLLSFIGLPFMVMSWWDNRPMMIYFCTLPLVLWTTLMLTNYGNGQYFELSPEITQLFGYSHSIMVFASITLQFVHYDRVTRNYSVALRSSLEAQKRANSAKTAFLRSMSHEMRTPLGAILGAADLLQNSPDAKADINELTKIITSSGNDMLSLTEKSTSFARVTAGDLEPHPEPVSLTALLGRVLSRFQDKIADKEIQLNLTNASEGAATNIENLHALADPAMLSEALSQVFENALTYTPHGGAVTLTLSSTASAETLRLIVTDTGPGIAEHQREAVFEPYERLDQAYGSQSGGGVGLTIARAYLTAMGGQILLEEAQEGGTRVLIDLPTARV